IPEMTSIRAALSPVPNEGNFTVTLENRAKEVIVEITDINGGLVFTQRYENSQELAIKTALTAGNYMVKLTTDKGMSIQKMMVR
ncbi:MAG: T9SS type A sorting domain-containing protein, partial [Bacteroidia bacterium]|nr:T9SS type A sorting domain-containing protein [Bacteroidia bacterium]